MNQLALDAEIIARLNLVATYQTLGLRFTDQHPTPRANGFIECFAADPNRDDKNASAAISARTGRYIDKGGSGENLSLWDFAAKYGKGTFLDWRAARKHFAEQAGLSIERGRPSKDPRDNLVFSEWTAGNLRLAAMWCSIHKKGTSLEALLACGARVAGYPKKSRAYTVLAFPVHGPNLLHEDPIAWVIYDIYGRDLPVWNKKGKVDRTVRMKSIGQTSGGLIGMHALLRLSEPNCQCDRVWKVEGTTDLLAAWTSLPPERRDRELFITTAGAVVDVPPHAIALLAGHAVRVIGDADTAGEAGAVKWCAALCGKAANLRHVRLPYEVSPSHGKDLRDFLEDSAAGSLLTIERASPEWEPSMGVVGVAVGDASSTTLPASGANQTGSVPPSSLAGERAEGDGRAFSNYTIQTLSLTSAAAGDGGAEVPLAAPAILADLRSRMDAKGIRYGTLAKTFFVHDSRGVYYISNQHQLFGWLRYTFPLVNWRNAGEGFLKQAELLHALERTSRQYTNLHDLPHEPLLGDVYYSGEPIEPGPTDHVFALIDRFCPATDEDWWLILSLFLTPLWGGPAGQRPAFAITAQPGAGEARGRGKTAVVTMLARLYGGSLSLTMGDRDHDMRSRLLSDSGREIRIVDIDNLKSFKASSSSLESLITAPKISGKMMYVGDASDHNYKTFVFTVNAPSMSEDLAKRCVCIQLGPPARSGGWESETRGYIDTYRREIVAGMIEILRREPRPITAHTRWAEWERGVISKIDFPNEVLNIIRSRQGEINVETEEAEAINEFFHEKLADLGYSLASDSVLVSSRIAAKWLCQALGEKNESVVHASRRINQMIDEGKLGSFMSNKTREYGRGFWVTDAKDGFLENRYRDLDDRLHSHKQGWGPSDRS